MKSRTNEEVLDSILRKNFHNRNKSKKPVFAYIILRSDILEIINKRGWTQTEIESECTSDKTFNQLLKLDKYQLPRKIIERNRLMYFIRLFFCLAIIIIFLFLGFPSCPFWLKILITILFAFILLALMKLSFEPPAWMTLAAFAESYQRQTNLDCISTFVEHLSRKPEIHSYNRSLKKEYKESVSEKRKSLHQYLNGLPMMSRIKEIKQFLQWKKRIRSKEAHFIGITLWDTTEAITYLKNQKRYIEFFSKQVSYEEEVKALTGKQVKDSGKLRFIIDTFCNDKAFHFLTRIDHISGDVFFVLPGGNNASPVVLWKTINSEAMKSFDYGGFMDKFEVPLLIKILRKNGFTTESNTSEEKLCYTRIDIQKAKGKVLFKKS